MILLYLLPCEAEDKLKEDIIAALKPYVSLAPADIHLTSRDDKYSAALRLPAAKGTPSPIQARPSRTYGRSGWARPWPTSGDTTTTTSST